MTEISFISDISDEEIKKERFRARELRKTQWWKNKKGSGRCYYCRKSVHPSDLTMDHIVPVVRGGKSRKNNLAACCKTCNNQKKHMVPSEWKEYLCSL